MNLLKGNHNKLLIDAELIDYFFLLLKLGQIVVGMKTQQQRVVRLQHPLQMIRNSF